MQQLFDFLIISALLTLALGTMALLVGRMVEGSSGNKT